MVKLVIFLKRKPGLSVAEFRDYYESHHRKLGESHVPGAARYVRRYIEPVPGEQDAPDLGFDVITELWFDDRAAYDKAMAYAAQPEIAADLARDEEHFLDRSRMLFTGVHEVDSDLGRAWA